MFEVKLGLAFFVPIALCTLLFMRQWRWWPIAALVLWVPTVLPLLNNFVDVDYAMPPLVLYLFLIFGGCGVVVIARWNLSTTVSDLGSAPLMTVRRHPILSSIVAVVTLVSFCAALGPEVRGDSIIYHITVAQLFALQHRMIELPTLILAYIPQGQQLLYACCMSVMQNEVLARLMHWFAGMLLCVGTYETARRVLGLSRGLSLAATAMLMMFPIWIYLATSTYVDLPGGLWILAALYLLLLRPNTSCRADTKAVVLSAILAGGAIGTKYTAGIIGLLPLLCVLLTQQITRTRTGTDTPRSSAAKIMLYATIATIVFSPWLIRNFAWTGNPVCPTMMSVLGPADVPQSTLEWGDIQPGPKDLSSGVSLPILYLTMPFSFGDFGNYLPQLALLIGVFCLLLRLPRSFPTPVKLILIFLGISYLLGIPTGAIRRDCRFVMAHVALCAVLVVFWYQQIARLKPVLAPRVALAVMLLMFVAWADRTYKMFADLNEHILPPLTDEARDEYRAARLPNYAANCALASVYDPWSEGTQYKFVLGAAYPANRNYVLVGQPISPQYFMPAPENVQPQDLPRLYRAGVAYILGNVPADTAAVLDTPRHAAGVPLYMIPH